MSGERLTVEAIGQNSSTGEWRVTISHANEAGSRLYDLRVGDALALPVTTTEAKQC